MKLWEKREVPRPPEYTIEYCSKELAQKTLGTSAQSLLESIQRGHMALDDKEVASCQRKEVGILTASLYRNGRHRTEKFYRVLKKVEKCCARWQQLGVVEELDRLYHLLPRMVLERRTLRLPSKQMFEYLLARLLGAYHLLLHLDGICREAASLLLYKISTGHFFSTAVAFLSNVSRIRVLAMDFAAQVAKIYDDILPQVSLLKGSNAPPLLDTTSLPTSLSCHLQQHCSTLDVSGNSQSTNKLSAKISILDSLNISKKENSTSTSKVDQFINPPEGKTLVNEELVSSKATESSDRADVSVSSIFLEEDIGECVQMTKGQKKAEGAKRKVSRENYKDYEISDESASKIFKKSKSLASVNPSLNSKKKQVKKNLLNNDFGKVKQSKTVKSYSKPYEEQCSPAFVKHFKAVKRQSKNINSVDNLRKFLEREKKNRQEKVTGRVSVLLKKEDWREFAKFVRIKLDSIKGLSKINSGDCEALQQLLRKTKVKVKFWLLFPHLKGRKPVNWKTVLESMTSLSYTS